MLYENYIKIENNTPSKDNNLANPNTHRKHNRSTMSSSIGDPSLYSNYNQHDDIQRGREILQGEKELRKLRF